MTWLTSLTLLLIHLHRHLEDQQQKGAARVQPRAHGKWSAHRRVLPCGLHGQPGSAGCSAVRQWPETSWDNTTAWAYTLPVCLPDCCRTIDANNPAQGKQHWTMGCHSSVGFLNAVLRVVKIPVLPVWVCGHELAYFPTEGLYLDHGMIPTTRASRIPQSRSLSCSLTRPPMRRDSRRTRQ